MSANSLVTLQETKALLRYTGNDNDPRLSLMISAASESILRFLKSDGDEYRDTGGELQSGQVPDDIRLATAILAGIYDRNMDVNDAGIFEAERLPPNVEAILHSRRDPTVA